MVKLNINLRFSGQAEEAFNFYKSVFGGELFMLQRYRELRERGEKIAEKDADKLTFVGLPVGAHDMLMADDILESGTPGLVQGDNYMIDISVENKAEADRIFNSLSAGGAIKVPLAVQFWGSYYGCFTDKFGVNWSVTWVPQKVK